jgi:flagellar biosynthesis protein FlhA
MDGASKFVRGDAIAGLIITAINIVGGIAIGYSRHGMSMGESADIFVKLSVGDGLVTQIPALIVSLAAGLLVSKGGTRGSADKAVFGQLGAYPRALFVAALLLFVLALMPGLPALPFLALGTGWLASPTDPCAAGAREEAAAEAENEKARNKQEEEKNSLKSSLITSEIELLIGKQLSTRLLTSHQELAFRMGKMRKKFAHQYGFVVPDVKLTDDFTIPPKSYRIKIHGTVVAEYEMRVGEVMVLIGSGEAPEIPGEEVREPAFGMRAYSVPETFADDLKRDRFTFADNMSVLLTHLSEVIATTCRNCCPTRT